MTPVVSQLFLYPIKSCAGISVSELNFDKKGPLFDRRWMLVDAKTGGFLSQRKLPKMALITTRIEGGRVWAEQKNSNNEESICLPVDGDVCDVKVWSDEVEGVDCGDKAALWFSQLLDYDCRLIYQADCLRFADTDYAEENTQISFADGFPLLVVAQSSIDRLNADCEGAEISATNFRPNIVVSNTVEFAEKNWLYLQAETLEMKVVKPCQRCVIPTINPNTAVKEPSIMPVLLHHCRRDKKIYFGQNLTFISAGDTRISVGQALKIEAD